VKIRPLFAKIRNLWLLIRIENQIYGRIFPHLEREKDFGYPFQSDKEFEAHRDADERELERLIASIRTHSENMPRAYGEAFRYLAFRDLRNRAMQYEKIARQRVQPKTCDPRFLAVRA